MSMVQTYDDLYINYMHDWFGSFYHSIISAEPSTFKTISHVSSFDQIPQYLLSQHHIFILQNRNTKANPNIQTDLHTSGGCMLIPVSFSVDPKGEYKGVFDPSFLLVMDVGSGRKKGAYVRE